MDKTYNMWNGLIYHTCMTLLTIIVTPPNYISNYDDFIIQKPLSIPISLHMVYLLQLLYYIIALKYDATDKFIMKLHDIVTIIVISVSWCFNYIPVGVVVMLIHDSTDIPLYILRILRTYQGSKDPYRRSSVTKDYRSNFGNYIMYLSILSVLVSWGLIRIFYFGDLILRCRHVAIFQSEKIAVSCLMCLWIMHVYWYGMITSKVTKVLF